MLLIARGTIALDKLRADLETWLKWSPDESLVTHSKMEDQQLLSLLQKHARHPPGASKRRKACKSLMERLSQYWEQGRSEAVLAACIEAEAEDLNLHHPGHPNRATLCSNLAYSLNNHFQQTNDIGLLDEAIMLAQEALNLCPPGHLDRAVLCGNLAATLRTRFQQVGELVLIDRAVELEREALHLRAPGHPDRVLSCENLAVSLKLRFDQTGEDSLLGEMMMLQRESLDGRPPGHLRRTMSCRGLAASLTERYKRSGDVTLLEDIIALEREVLSVCPPGDPDRALSCANLAHSLWTYSQHMRNMAALDEAIGLEKQVLTLRPPGHPRRLQSIQGLANLLRTQYEQTGKMLALEQAIALERQVLEFRPRGHADRSLSCTSLALSLGILFGQSGELPLLDEAIQLEQEALDLCPPGHPDRASSCSNLAASLALRFQEAGEIALIDRAMTLEREALDLRPPGHAERAWSCGYLARLYTTRLAQTGEMTLLDEAILLQREAIDILPPSHPERAPLCGNLATSLWKRHNKTGEMTLLLQAIDLEREALALRPAGHSQRAWSCGNLSTSLQTLFEKTQIAAVLDESIELAREALSLRGPGHPQRAWSHIQLAHLLRSKISLCRMDGVAERDAFSEVSSLLDAALHLYSPQHPQRWRSLKGKAELAALLHDAAAITQHLREILDSPVYDDVEDVLRYTIGAVSQINIGTLSHSQKEELMGVYDAILELVALAAGSAVAMPTQLRHINRGSTLGAAAFMLSILLNELPKGLQLIERARGVIWAQMLHMRNPDLDGVPPEHGAKLRRLLQSTDTPAESIGKGEAHPSSVDFATHDRLYAQRGQLQETIRQIRSLPGLGNLMRGPDAQTLLTTAALNPVAILVADETACHVLVITSADNSLIDIPIPDVNQHTLADLTFVGLTSGQRGPTSYQYDRGMRVSKGMSSPHARLAKLWRTVVRPVIAHLGLSTATGRARPRIHWCCTGAFAFVPIHAAGVYEGPNQECCADYVVSSYIPTLTALLEAQKGVRSFTPEQINFVGLAAETSHTADMPRLRFVIQEVQETVSIVEAAGGSAISDTNVAAKSDVLALLKSANMVHLACHGVQHAINPHESRFCLKNGDLSVTELMEMDLKHAFLAFLSACETAKGDPKHADEVVHLAATMLFAGFKSVVATMWAMGDEDGPFIARHFYQELFAHQFVGVDSVPYALDYAVAKLRKSGVPPERWATFVHMGV